MKYVFRIVGTLYCLAAIFCFFLPLPTISEGKGAVVCFWEDGSGEMSLADALRALSHVDEAGVHLEDGERQGVVPLTARERDVYRTLALGDLGELTALGTEGLSPLAGTALTKRFASTLWLDGGDAFHFTGRRIAAMDTGECWECQEVVLLGGEAEASYLLGTGASVLYLRARAEADWRTVAETGVKRVYAASPYFATESAVYLDEPGGRRLLFGQPDAEEIYVEDIAFADEGALLPCGNIVSLSLPFAGDAPYYHDGFNGDAACLFSDGETYHVPETLKRITVRGGRIAARAFFEYGNVEEISACGVYAATDAFFSLSSLRYLHTAQRYCLLTGEFLHYTAPCGCTIYERIGE